MYLNEFDATMQLIKGKWKIMLLYALHAHEVVRFNELQRLAQSSHKTLSAQLKALEEDGLILRTVYAEVPPRVDYRLTAKGQSLIPVLDAICDWGLAHTDPDLLAETLCDQPNA
ncbi:winged helix-turn-helix transcriptional regulator [Neisseriaceae bacterium CLB008]|nr:helix-turn-helix transcriptional regulator [Neisseriaceae bacterium]